MDKPDWRGRWRQGCGELQRQGLGNTRCRIDGYGTIDLEEMAIVHAMMGQSVRPGIRSSDMDEA